MISNTTRNWMAVLALAGSAAAQSGTSDGDDHRMSREGVYFGYSVQTGADAASREGRDEVGMYMTADGRAFVRRNRLYEYEAVAVRDESAADQEQKLVRLRMGSMTVITSEPVSWGGYTVTNSGPRTYNRVLFDSNRTIPIVGYRINLSASMSASCTLNQQADAWSTAADAPEGAKNDKGARINGTMRGSAHGTTGAGISLIVIRVRAEGDLSLMQADLDAYGGLDRSMRWAQRMGAGMVAADGDLSGHVKLGARGTSGVVRVILEHRWIKFKRFLPRLTWRQFYSKDLVTITAATERLMLLDHYDAANNLSFADVWMN